MFRAIAIVGCVLGIAARTQAADPVAWLPPDLNAVARINVADLYKTPLARQEEWAKHSTESFIHQEAFVPPGTNQILIGAQLDLSERLASNRKCAVVVPDSNQKLDKLAPWLPGGIQQISGKPGAQFGDDGYVVDTGDGSWLATMNSSRQTIARWLKSGPSSGSGLSPYLKNALTSKSNTAQVVMAVDLQDNFSREQLRETIKQAGWFSSDSTIDSAADVLSSATGITISIAVDKERSGSLTVDFAKPATALQPILSKLVDAVLEHVGATSDEVQQWKWSVSGNRILGAGPISPGGVRRLLSILDPPALTHVISASETPTDDKMAKTSQKYCKSVRVLLDDLQKELKKTKDNHALWFERYARKVDDLPKLNVDGDLLDYSAKVSNSLRYQGQVQRMTLIQAGTRIAQSGANYATVSGYVSPYGSYGWVKPLDPQAPNTIAAEESQTAKSVRYSEWKQIEDGMTDIRRNLTEKYKLEF